MKFLSIAIENVVLSKISALEWAIMTEKQSHSSMSAVARKISQHQIGCFFRMLLVKEHLQEWKVALDLCASVQNIIGRAALYHHTYAT